MATSNESKRIGRDQELRSKLKEASERFEKTFGYALTIETLKRFLDDSEWNNKFLFLRDRIGVLSDTDVSFVRDILKVSVKSPVSQELTENALESVSEDLEDIDVSNLG